MTEIKNQKPCLVQTGQGFSVEYNQKLLYSKYNPSKQICMKIDSMEFLPGTLVLGFSAVLNYGIENLLKKLPENCLVLLCEADKELREFSFSNETENLNDSVSFPGCIKVSEKEMYNLPVILQKSSYTFSSGETVSFAGVFKRVIRLDFSAGVQFHSDFYDRLEMACVNAVKQFWTNRFTLAKFGRKYSRNMFRNLSVLEDSVSLSSFFRSVEKPIFVFGAGESAEKGIEKLKDLELKGEERPFILCADTAFPMLRSHRIIPDGIVVDEAQSVIAQSFIGARKSVPEGVYVFQSLCSLPHVAGRNFDRRNLVFYGTEYASNDFFDSLKQKSFLPPVIPAFGSVGITVYILACLFRKDCSIPINYYGLDFAYSSGKTHARGTPAHKRQLRNMSKIKGGENFAASFGSGALKLPENSVYPFTTPILLSYAQTFSQVREQGINLSEDIMNAYRQKKISDNVKRFLLEEKNALEELRDLLSGTKKLSEQERAERIKNLAENRQYLYLHFPDGYRFSMDLNFLKRIRGEIDGFLKVLQF